MIVSDASAYDTPHVITGIAGKKGFSAISIEKDMMNAEIGFGRRALEVLEDMGISFEHLPSGIDTMTIVVATAAIKGKRDRLIHALNRAVRADHIEITDGLSLIAVVGRGMVKAKGTAARVFNAVSDAGVNIRMIDQGSSERNIILSVDEDSFEQAMSAIYEEFVK